MTNRATKKAGASKARAKPRQPKGRVKRVVDRNTEAIERIHRAVVGFPLDVLEQIERLERPVARVRKLQDRSITATYDLVRGIEREVGQLVRLPEQKKPPVKARGAARKAS
jgi:hypothetical protein